MDGRKAGKADSQKVKAASEGESKRAGRGILLLMLLLALAGLGVAADLTTIHLWVHTDPGYRSFCAVSETVNCDAVAESPYSIFLGVPVSVWGMFAYLLISGLVAAGLVRRRPGSWPAGSLLALSAFAVLTSIVLGTISVLAISSICILCFTTYGINILLLVLASLLSRRRGGLAAALSADVRYWSSRPASSGSLAVVLVLVVGLLMALYPPYWKVRLAQGSSLGGLASGISEEGDLWIGATDPKLTIIEYSDYQCPHCRRGHREMRNLAAANPDNIRFIHRHFPLDMGCNPMVRRPFHPDACQMARMAVCAARQGKGWQANDLLFHLDSDRPMRAATKRPPSLDRFAEQLALDLPKLEQCMADPASLQVVRKDIDAGMALNVRGTPSYEVNGKLFPGHVPREKLTEWLGEQPARSSGR